MADRFQELKRLFEVAASAVAVPSRGRPGGKDFMRDDLTYGADNAEY